MLRPYIYLILLTLLAIPAATPAAGQEEDRYPRDNAATYYWQAAALMRRPARPAELEVLNKVMREIPMVPAPGLNMRPDETAWLLNEGPMLRAIQAGSLVDRFDFQITATGPLPTLDHLPMLRILFRRSLDSAKAFQFAQNHTGAAAIYTSLLRLCSQLDQDNDINASLAGARMIQDLAFELEGFFLHGPPPQALDVLILELTRRPKPLYHPGRHLRDEALRLADWLRDGNGTPADKISRLYGEGQRPFGSEVLKALPEEEVAPKLATWIDGFIKDMEERAAATDLPYKRAYDKLVTLDEARMKLRGVGEINQDNPISAVMLPAVEKAYERLLLMEAQLQAVTTLTYATRQKALTGKWPETLEEIETFMQAEPRMDPFSGEPVFYRLRHDKPYIKIRVPKWIAKDSGLMDTFDLHDRGQKEVAVIRQMRNQIAEAMRQDGEASSNDRRRRPGR